MKPARIKIETSSAAYAISVGSDLLASSGEWAKRCLGKSAKKIVVVSNANVSGLYGSTLTQSLSDSGFEVSTFLIGDGERFKTLRSVEKILAFLAEQRISRSDAIVALGGGVVGDVAGFAASVHLRGIRFLQIPTTLLAMVDSSVGGKTGVNGTGGKNTIGAFHQPSGVLVDVETLESLPQRQLNAGFFEAVKHAMLAGGDVLDRTTDAIEKRDAATLTRMIKSSVSFKASIVAGDEREDAKNRTASSRKILNFGHTFAHALEKATKYRRFLHGEAVGYGLVYAAGLSKSLDFLPQKDVNLLYDVVQSVGILPSLAQVDSRGILEAFRFDKKIQAGSLQMILLRGIGKPVIVDAAKIPQSAHVAAFERLLKL